MNFIPKRCPVICHIEKEGAVSSAKKSMINLYMISFSNDGHFFISKRGAYGERL